MVPEEDHNILERFVRESRQMAQEILPLVRALVEQPGSDLLLPDVLANASRLFHAIRGTSTLLGLEHLAAPAEAMEHLLNQVRSGEQLTPQQLSLLAESCTFMVHGLDLALREKSDQRLAASAAALSSAILASLDADAILMAGRDMESQVTSEMRQVFIQESEQLLAAAEQEFVLWDFIVADHQRVADLCRLLHRLKQNFALYDFTEFERLCMALESTLHRYLQGEFFQTEYPERVFLRCIDAMREALAGFGLAEEMNIAGLEQHLSAVQGLIRQPIGELLIEAGLVDPRAVDEALAMQRASRTEQPRRLGEVLVAMGEVTEEQVQHVLKVQLGQGTPEQQVDATRATDELGPSMQVSATLARHEVKVNSQIFSRMISVIQQMAVLPLPSALQPLVAELHQLARTCNQEALASFSGRIQRIVHDLAMEYKKRIHFSFEGVEIFRDELDQTIFADVFIPLLRNSVEHGLETVEERIRLGKRKSGRLTLLALRQGEEVWVSVEDDGQGIDLKKIADYCLVEHWITAENVGRLTGAEILQIFLDRRASAVVEASKGGGKYNGLSSVNRQLRNMHGKMEMWSRAGKGTRVTVRLRRAS